MASRWRKWAAERIWWRARDEVVKEVGQEEKETGLDSDLCWIVDLAGIGQLGD